MGVGVEARELGASENEEGRGRVLQGVPAFSTEKAAVYYYWKRATLGKLVIWEGTQGMH